MQSPSASARVGASISVLGAVLALSSDGITASQFSSVGPQALWWVISPALIMFGIGTFAYLRKLQPWLLILQFVVSVLGSLLHFCYYILLVLFACFDMCPPGSTIIDYLLGNPRYLLLLGLGGFLLSAIGAFVTLRASQPDKA